MAVVVNKVALSKSKLWSAQNVKDLAAAVVLIGQREARQVLAALSPTAITNNSGGSTAGPVSLVGTGSLFSFSSGPTLASRTQFNAALVTIDNALATLASYLNTNFFVAISHPIGAPGYTLNASGVVTANVVPVLSSSILGVDNLGLPAQGVLTTSANYTNGDTVTVGSKTYTMQAALTNVDGNVKIAATEALSIVNLVNAINGFGGVPGTDYALAMSPNASASAALPTIHNMTVTAKIGGVGGNTIATTKVAAAATWAAATLLGGVADAAMLRSEANTQLTIARNNFATLLKGYNMAITGVGALTVADASGGKSDVTLTLNTQGAANTVVTNAQSTVSDVAGVGDMNNALLSLSNNISYLANLIGTVLLAAGTLTSPQNIVIVP